MTARKANCCFLISILLFASCKSNQTTLYQTKPSESELKIASILANAQTFMNVPYRYGGTTRSGMDCSGLIHVLFKQENIILPRSSWKIADLGKKIVYKNIKIGDLVFFITNPKKSKINHVGLVTQIDPTIIFIHATTSKGVTTTRLDQSYWTKNFIQARRLDLRKLAE